MTARHSMRRGVEYQRSQRSLPGQKRPDRQREIGLQDHRLVVGPTIVVEGGGVLPPADQLLSQLAVSATLDPQPDQEPGTYVAPEGSAEDVERT